MSKSEQEKGSCFDGEIEELWSEGLKPESAAQLLSKVGEAGKVEAPVGLKARIIGTVQERVNKRNGLKWLKLAPVAVPAVVLLWFAAGTNQQQHLNQAMSTGGDQVYVELAGFVDEMMGGDILDDDGGYGYASSDSLDLIFGEDNLI